MRADGALARVAGRAAAVAGAVVVAAVPVYVWVEPWWRPLVARAASALVLAVTVIQLRRLLVEQLEAGGVWATDEARRRPWRESGVPHHFKNLASDVRAALRSRRYFEQGLWPRLTALTSRPLVPPPPRPARGPGLADLRRVIADLEDGP